jgi:phosphoesterase RecJ-like protein
MKGLKKAQDSILKAKTVAIACHINPDGDAIGSMLSLGLGLEDLGKKVYMVSQDGVPNRYQLLPGADQISRNLSKKVDLAITVDCNTKEMLGKSYASLRKADTILEIDHHEVREAFGDMRFIDPKAPAVGEMIYVLLKRLKADITKDIAQNILTSLIVETNSFKLPNVRPFTFKVCAEMVKTGLNFYRLVDMVFWSHSRQVAVLTGICLSRCRFLEEGRLAWSAVRKKDFQKVQGKEEDADTIADEIRAIKGVDVVVFFREKTNKDLRVSLRSKNNINVAGLAKKYGGGGHYDVAGCVIPNTPFAMKKLLNGARALLN